MNEENGGNFGEQPEGGLVATSIENNDGGDAGLSFTGAYKTALLSDIPGLVQTALAVLLWLATAWIPYVNIWTTLALVGLPLAIVKGEKISPVEVFMPRHKDKLLDLLLLGGILSAVAGFIMALTSIFTPLILMGGFSKMWVLKTKTLWVFAIGAVPLAMAFAAWSLSALLVVGREMKPFAALEKSRLLTNGAVLKIILLFAPIFVVAKLAAFKLFAVKYVGWLLAGALVIALATVWLRLLAVVWSKLTTNENE